MSNLIQSAVKLAVSESKADENTTKTPKTEEKAMEKSLEEQKAELVKSNPEVLEKVRKAAQSESKSTQRTTTKPKPKREVTPMTDRSKAEKVLETVCKELKLGAPVRINAKEESKSGLGALQAKVHGHVKVAVRSNDIVLFIPQGELGFGKVDSARYVHVTKMTHGDANLEKAFKKALKDKKTGADWAKEMGFVPRSQGKATPKEVTLDSLKKQEEEIKAKLDAIKAAKAKLSKKAKKPSMKKNKVVATIAPTTTTDPVVA